MSYTKFVKPGASFQQHEIEAFWDRTKEYFDYFFCPVLKCLDSMLLKTRSMLYKFDV